MEASNTPEVRFCSSCGAPIQNGSKFCASCGRTLSDQIAPNQTPLQPAADRKTAFEPVQTNRTEHKLLRLLLLLLIISYASSVLSQLLSFRSQTYQIMPQQIVYFVLTVLIAGALIGCLVARGKARTVFGFAFLALIMIVAIVSVIGQRHNFEMNLPVTEDMAQMGILPPVYKVLIGGILDPICMIFVALLCIESALSAKARSVSAGVCMCLWLVMLLGYAALIVYGFFVPTELSNGKSSIMFALCMLQLIVCLGWLVSADSIKKMWTVVTIAAIGSLALWSFFDDWGELASCVRLLRSAQGAVTLRYLESLVYSLLQYVIYCVAILLCGNAICTLRRANAAESSE